MAWDDAPPNWDDAPPEPELFGSATSTIQKVGNVLGAPFKALESVPGYQAAKTQVENSPIGLGQRVFDMASQGANKLAEKTTENLSEKGLDLSPPFSPAKPIPVSPEVAARVGTAVSMAPDILSMLALPGEGAAPESKPAFAPNDVSPLPSKAPPPISPSDLRSAINLRGKTYVGQPGEIHADVINQIAKELGQNPDTVIDSVNKIGDQGFAQNGKFLSREEARGLTGKRPEAASLFGESEEAPEKSTFDTLKEKVPKDVLDPMQQVNKYLQKEYGQAAQKPGFANTAADYLKEHSQNMSLKELGAAPGQVRKIGIDKARELADYARQNGLVGPKIGTIGREKLLDSKLEDAGGAVGAFRKMASDRGAVHDPNQLIQQIRSNLDAKYLTKGMYQGQKGSYMKALDELKKTDRTAQGMSDKVTEMFKEAKNQNPLSKPEGPIADVARQARDINHQLIAKKLSPQEMTLYEKSLEDYGALTQIKEFAKRRASTEAGGRLGPGAGISRAAVQKFLDSFGYRAEAQIADKLSDFIRKNPDAMTKPTNLFRNYIDEAAEAVHEMGDASH